MYDGYRRVSRVAGREGDGFVSPEEQRDKIQAFARATGVKVRMNEPELDRTGSKLERPILDGIMARIEAGKSEGLIVARVNRLSRAGLGDAIKLVERIHDAGARVAFAELGNIDPRTAQGEMVVNLWLLIARMQWREYQEKFNEDKRRAVVEKGWHVGPTPLGFEKRDRNKAGKLVGPLYRTADAPKVAKLFDASAGEGLQAALRYAERAWPERSWSVWKVRRLLANRIYRGEVVIGDLVGRIEPLVDSLTWDMAQHPVRDHERRRAKLQYPLSGIARCAACGKTLVGHTTGTNKKRAYRCTTADCPLHVQAEPLEALVLDAVREAPRRGRLAADEILKLTAPIMRRRRELEEYVENADVGDAELFRRGLEARERRLTDAQRAWDAARDRSEPLPDPDDEASRQQLFRLTVADLTVKRSRKPLDKRVKLKLAA
jgi:DNA invertase Pin-like site-specific DNA recombinase